jgi:cell division protein FtsX
MFRAQRYEELIQWYPFERLIMDLIDKENAFEKALTVEPVEDKLISKQ